MRKLPEWSALTVAEKQPDPHPSQACWPPLVRVAFLLCPLFQVAAALPRMSAENMYCTGSGCLVPLVLGVLKRVQRLVHFGRSAQDGSSASGESGLCRGGVWS